MPNSLSKTVSDYDKLVFKNIFLDLKIDNTIINKI